MRFSRLVALACAATGSASVFAQSSSNLLSLQTEAISELKQVQPDAQLLYSGDSIERVYGAPLGGGYDPITASAQFVSRYKNLFKAGDGEFTLKSVQPIDFNRFTAVTYRETVAGIPVEDGSVTVLMKQGIGLPIVLVSNNAKFASKALPTVTVTAKKAVQLFAIQRPTLNQFSVPTLAIWNDEGTPRLTWKFTANGFEVKKANSDCCETGKVAAAYTVFMDAHTGQLAHLRNEIHNLDVSGSAKGWASPGLLPDWPAYSEVLTAMPYLQVSISGGSSAFADVNGNFTIPNAGVAPVTVTSGLTGRYVNVIPNQGVLLTQALSVTPPGPANLVYGASLAQFDVAQVNGYIQTNVVHDFAKAQNPAYPGIDIALTCNVNLTSTCNAFFSNAPLSINFYNQGGACVNTAYSSVVHHEYGHFIINQGGTGQGGYGEGMADTIAALLSDDPRLGLDFQGQGTGPIRNAINSIHYPENAASEIHTAGMIVSGAFWETVRRMDTTIGHAAGLTLMRRYAINSILLHPPGITPGLTVDVLTLDDDDANLLNGTPHYDDIAFGFGLKGLTAPAVQYLNIVPVSVPGDFLQYQTAFDPFIPFKVHVTPNATQPDVNQVRFFWRINTGAWQSLLMNEYADPGFMFSGIDQPNSGDSVSWYVEAKDTLGHSTFYPAGGASSPASFIVASALQTIFTDTFESNLGWTVANTALVSGAWVRADPIGTFNGSAPSNPENDSGDTGAQCMFTGQGTVGGALGEADVDGGPTDLVSPTFNLAGADGIVNYSQWFYSVNGVVDNFLVQVSNDNGTTWVTVASVASPANAWAAKSFRVSQFVAPTATVKVRFRANDNPNDSVTEAAIDNVIVKKIVL